MSPLFLALLLLLHLAPLKLAQNQTQQGDFFQCLSSYSPPFTNLSHLVFFPNTSSYSALLLSSIQNLRYSSASTSKPLLILSPDSELQVQAIVICTKRFGLALRLRSGGHDYEGLSYHSWGKDPFLLLDLAKLRDVNVDLDQGTAWVQAGATTGDVYYRIGEKSRTHAFPAGVCATLGVGGHFSGGGMGTLVRKYGLAADNILDARMVDADGWILDKASMGDDVFWAIRGGGGASFGVIVAWKVKLVPVPPTVTAFTIKTSPEEGGLELIHRWQTISPALDKNLFIEAVIRIIKAAGSGPETLFNGLFLGGCAETLVVMNDEFPELGMAANDCKEMSWVQSTLYFAGLTNGEPLEALMDRKLQQKAYVKAKTDFVKEPIPFSAWGEVLKRFARVELAFMFMDPYGGRMDEIAEDSIPFPHRKGNLYNIQYIVAWQSGEEEDAKKHTEWIRALHEMMEPHVSSNPRAAYVNFRDMDLGMNKDGESCYLDSRVWGRKYFKGNFWRLAVIKGNMDPHNFFRSEQSVPPLIDWA